MAKFKIGETVYLKCDPEKNTFIVTGILSRKRYKEYEVTGADALYYKQDFELEYEVKEKQVTGFKTK